jgi:hypothetical protein
VNCQNARDSNSLPIINGSVVAAVGNNVSRQQLTAGSSVAVPYCRHCRRYRVAAFGSNGESPVSKTNGGCDPRRWRTPTAERDDLPSLFDADVWGVSEHPRDIALDTVIVEPSTTSTACSCSVASGAIKRRRTVSGGRQSLGPKTLRTPGGAQIFRFAPVANQKRCTRGALKYSERSTRKTGCRSFSQKRGNQRFCK